MWYSDQRQWYIGTIKRNHYIEDIAAQERSYNFERRTRQMKVETLQPAVALPTPFEALEVTWQADSSAAVNDASAVATSAASQRAI